MAKNLKQFKKNEPHIFWKKPTEPHSLKNKEQVFEPRDGFDHFIDNVWTLLLKKNWSRAIESYKNSVGSYNRNPCSMLLFVLAC